MAVQVRVMAVKFISPPIIAILLVTTGTDWMKEILYIYIYSHDGLKQGTSVAFP